MQLLGLNFPRDKFTKREQTMRLYTTIYSCKINARAAAYVCLQFLARKKPPRKPETGIKDGF